jgi:hypothetical protein
MAHNVNHLAIFEFVMRPGHSYAGLPSAQAVCFVAEYGNEYDHLEQLRSMLQDTVEPYASVRVRSCDSFGDYLS